MSGFGRQALVITLVRMLITPFENTDAFRFGLIDATGRKIRNPLNAEEEESYTPLHRFIFLIKAILEKAGISGKITGLAAAYHLVKESLDREIPEDVLEKRLTKFISEEYCFLEEQIELERILEEIAANNTAGVEVKNPDAIPKRKMKTVKDLLARRNTTQ